MKLSNKPADHRPTEPTPRQCGPGPPSHGRPGVRWLGPHLAPAPTPPPVAPGNPPGAGAPGATCPRGSSSSPCWSRPPGRRRRAVPAPAPSARDHPGPRHRPPPAARLRHRRRASRRARHCGAPCATASVAENDRSTLGMAGFCSESASKWKNLRIVSIPGFVVSPLRIFHKVVNGTPDAVEIAMSAALFSGSSRSLTRAADGICEFIATSYRILMTIATVFGRCPRYA